MKIKKRYKLLIIIIIALFIISFIYLKFYRSHEYYVSIGDYLSVSEINGAVPKNYNDIFHDKNKTKQIKFYNEYLNSSKLLSMLESDYKNISYYLNNSKYVVINVGNYELNSYKNLNEENIIDYLNNMHNVLYKVRKISNSKIFIVNLYNSSNKFELVNKKLFDYAKKYDLIYIDLNKLEFDKYYVICDKYYLNSKGMNKIGNFLLKNC